MDALPANAAVAPHTQLIQMGTAFWVSRILYAAAELNLADRLSQGPRHADELAQVCGMHSPSLYRLLRALASLGLLRQSSDQRFALTELGAALKSDAPGAARATLLSLSSSWFYSAWEPILDCLATGETGMQRMHGCGFFDYLAERPLDAHYFSAAMIGFNSGEPAAVAEAYDFSSLHNLVDVGGASGSMLAAILPKYPQLHGILFDRPHVLETVPDVLTEHQLNARVTLAPGDFFQALPAGADAYLLSHILHDWSEPQCLQILRNCRQAMRQDSRLLIVETVLPEGDQPHPGKLLDIAMLVITGGQERSAEQYAELLQRARFKLQRVVGTASAVSVVEAIPV